MKKFVVTLSVVLAFLLGGNVATAQETFEQGKSMVNLGIGVGKTKNQSLPPLSLTYERSLVSNLFDYGSIGLGAQIEVQGFDYAGDSGFDSFFGPRISWHYEWLENLDTYVSAMAGLQLERYPNFNEENKTSEMSTEGSFGFGFALGARYLFTRGFGVFAEGSTNISYFKVGATFNL